MPASWVWAGVGVGVVIGLGIVLTRGHTSDPGFQVWALLAVALTGVSGAVFVYGAVVWWDVRDRWGLSSRRLGVSGVLWWWLLVAFWVGSALIPLLRGDSLARGAALVATALIAAGPAVAAAEGVRQAADGDLHRPEPAWMYDTRDLSGQLRSLLVAGGSLVALATLSLGASRSLPRGDEVTPETVVVFGAMGSVVVAVMYLPAHGAVRRRALRVLAHYLPLPADADVGLILDAAGRRESLLTFMAVDVEVMSALRSNIVIVGPLFSAAFTLFLPTH